MADQRLVLYIKEQLKRGYDLYTIRDHLVKHGYNVNAVDEAIDGIYKPTIRHEIHLSKSTIVALGSVFAALLLIISAFFMFGQEPKQLLDLSIEVIEEYVEAGQELEFSIELSSLGAAKRYDVLLKYDVVKGKKIITSKEETIALETRTSATSRIKIPDDAEAGNYLLKATAHYNGKVAIASESFRVYEETEEEGCFDNIKNQGETEVDCGGPCEPCKEEEKCPSSCDDNNKCTDDYCSEETGFKCMHKEIKPCCGNNVCEEDEKESCASDCPEGDVAEEDELSGLNTWERLEKIKEISVSDPEKAGDYCSEMEEPYKDRCFLNIAETTESEISCVLIEDNRLKDDCYSKVAKAADNYEICEKISTETTTDRKDSCYMNFVIDGNYDFCNRLVNQYLKQSCEALKSIESGEVE